MQISRPKYNSYKQMTVTYLGVRPPAQCQVGLEPIRDVFVDGATRGGRWAYMCVACHGTHGVGLGVGRGTKYVKQADGRWLKVGK